MKSFRAAAIIIMALMLLGGGAGLWFASEVLTPSDPAGQARVVEIPQGATLKESADLLQKNGILKSAFPVTLLGRLTGASDKIQAGPYRLSPALSPYEILRKLVKGEVVLSRATIPEGLTIRQVAALLQEEGIGSAQEFLSAAVSSDVEEGFLFPDTYDFSPGARGGEIAGAMTARFKEVMLPVWEKYRSGGGTFTLKEAVTLASLVEKEAKLDRERPVIAAVYHNRLKMGKPLECDATIQYIIGLPKELLTYDDLKRESPYNTYLHSGLPPGPICNPGLSSLRAALHPAMVPYLYYVVKGDGSHVFNVRYEDHLRAVEQYSEWLTRRGK